MTERERKLNKAHQFRNRAKTIIESIDSRAEKHPEHKVIKAALESMLASVSALIEAVEMGPTHPNPNPEAWESLRRNAENY